MPHDVFISHSSKDKSIADAICATLEQNDIRCWIAPRDIRPGERWMPSIIDAIANSRVMVLVYSSHANESTQVVCEVEAAFAEEVTIIPFKLVDEEMRPEMKYMLRGRHWLNALTPPLEQHIQQLVNTVTAQLPGEGATSQDSTDSTTERSHPNAEPTQTENPEAMKAVEEALKAFKCPPRDWGVCRYVCFAGYESPPTRDLAQEVWEDKLAGLGGLEVPVLCKRLLQAPRHDYEAVVKQVFSEYPGINDAAQVARCYPRVKEALGPYVMATGEDHLKPLRLLLCALRGAGAGSNTQLVLNAALPYTTSRNDQVAGFACAVVKELDTPAHEKWERIMQIASTDTGNLLKFSEFAVACAPPSKKDHTRLRLLERNIELLEQMPERGKLDPDNTFLKRFMDLISSLATSIVFSESKDEARRLLLQVLHVIPRGDLYTKFWLAINHQLIRTIHNLTSESSIPETANVLRQVFSDCMAKGAFEPATALAETLGTWKDSSSQTLFEETIKTIIRIKPSPQQPNIWGGRVGTLLQAMMGALVAMETPAYTQYLCTALATAVPEAQRSMLNWRGGVFETLTDPVLDEAVETLRLDTDDEKVREAAKEFLEKRKRG